MRTDRYATRKKVTDFNISGNMPGIPGGQIVITGPQQSPGRTAVNALHVFVTGIAEVTIGSATAGFQ